MPPDEFPIGDILAVERDVIPLDGVDVFQRKEIDAIGDRVALAEAEQISRRLRISRTSVPRFLSPRLYAEVWKDGSLAYKIIRIYPVPLIASKSSLKCRSVPMSFGLPTSLMFRPRRRGESERYGIPIVRFLAVMLTALALVPAAAHLFALPKNIGLDSARYFTVQGIYRGWSMFGFMLLGALVANLGLALLLRRRPVPFALALTGFLLIATTLAVFFIWVYPANQATANWTTAPEDWERLRRLWECGHAAMPR